MSSPSAAVNALEDVPLQPLRDDAPCVASAAVPAPAPAAAGGGYGSQSIIWSNRTINNNNNSTNTNSNNININNTKSNDDSTYTKTIAGNNTINNKNSNTGEDVSSPSAVVKFSDAPPPTTVAAASSTAAAAAAKPDPNKILRWQVLLLLCIMQFGTEYCYDLPGSIGAGEGDTIQNYFAGVVSSTSTSSSSGSAAFRGFAGAAAADYLNVSGDEEEDEDEDEEEKASSSSYSVLQNEGALDGHHFSSFAVSGSDESADSAATAVDGKTYNQKMNQALYSFYSYPNMVMTIFGGLLIDKYLGLRRTSLIMSSIVVCSNLVFAFAVFSKQYWLMVIARIVFGCAGETLFVTQSTYMARWFAGTTLQSLAFGVSISFARFGGGATYIVSPWVARNFGGVNAAVAVACLVSAISFCGAASVAMVDATCEKSGRIGISDIKKYRANKAKKKQLMDARRSNRVTPTTTSPAGAGSGFTSIMAGDPNASKNNLYSPASPPSASVNGGLPLVSSTMSMSGIASPVTLGDVLSANIIEEAAPEATFKISFASTLPPTLWFLCISGGLCYAVVFPFISIAKTFFESVYGFDAITAANTAGFFHIVSSTVCPLMGAFVDRVGRSPLWFMGSNIGHISMVIGMMYFTDKGGLMHDSPRLMMFIMSFFYAMFVSATWSFVGLNVPSSATGFAFGIFTAFLNFGIATVPLFTGTILDAFTPAASGAEGEGEILPVPEGFFYTLAVFLVILCLALANSVVLLFADKKYNKGLLMMTPGAGRDETKKLRDAELVAQWTAAEAEEANKQLEKEMRQGGQC